MVDKDQYNKDEEETEDEEEELDEGGYKSVKDAVLFAIEVSPSMLLPPKDGVKGNTDSPTAAALKCAFALMQQRIISNPKDMIGILLYGTEQTKFHGEQDNSRGSLSYPHCYLLTDLNIPDAGDVKTLKKLVEDEDESAMLLVPSKESVTMANVLFCANQIFTTRAPNFASRRLFIVTDNDNPHAHDKALRASATVRAKDLYDLGVIIELFPISTPDHEFEKGKFYDDIIYSSFPTDPDAPAYIKQETSKVSSGDGISLLNSLLSEINSKAVARRALFSNLPLEIGPGFKISVKGYIIFKRQEPARSTYVWTHGEKPLIPKHVNTRISEDSARTVEKWEIRKAYTFGGEQIAFTPEEILSLRNFGDPGIRIIGFKPLSALPLWASTNKATFIYPSEEDYVGSTRVFSALQQKLLKDQKMAVTWFVARKNATPVIAALIPGEEKLGESGGQAVPPGLWIVQLPYADDIRKKPEMSHVQAPDELTDMMRPIVSQLQLPKAQYNPSKYPNPALQWHYRILQALALDEDLPEKPEDKAVPKYKQIEKRAGADIADWNKELEAQHRLVNDDFYSKSNTSKLAKRPAPASADDSAIKKVKHENEAMSDIEMKRHWNSRTLEKLKVVDLKAWLATKKQPTTNLKKAELLDSVRALFGD